eukprot:1001901-Rhodomonas_salina.1
MACSACPAGKFKGVNGSEACTACAAGTYAGSSGASACDTCPNGTTSLAGSGDALECICLVGYEEILEYYYAAPLYTFVDPP